MMNVMINPRQMDCQTSIATSVTPFIQIVLQRLELVTQGSDVVSKAADKVIPTAAQLQNLILRFAFVGAEKPANL